MAILRADEIRELTKEEVDAELEDLENELLRQRSILATGGAPENPGRIKEIRRTIARIKTIRNEREEENE
ncbi:MAG: 50S ribosomal protein L29 [Halobacteria archaeon]